MSTKPDYGGAIVLVVIALLVGLAFLEVSFRIQLSEIRDLQRRVAELEMRK